MQLLTPGNWFQREAGLHFNYPMASEMCRILNSLAVRIERRYPRTRDAAASNARFRDLHRE